MDWGVTERGFRRKTYDEIISTMEARAKDLFGPNIDLSSASPLALFLRVVAFALSLLWQVAERVYGSAYIDTATGQSLDYAVKYAGISRRPPSHAWRLVRFTGDPGVQIPRGFLVETESGIRYATLEAVSIGDDGQVEVMAQSVETGFAQNVDPAQLTVITNPIPGLSSVVGVDSERNVLALDRETDRELRERYYRSLSTGGTATLDSIRAAVLNVAGVRTVKVFHNPTMTTDEEGRPPKSVEVVVLGGSTDDVARAIHESIAAGIEPVGDVEVVVEDAGGEPQLIRFNRAEVVDIFVHVTVQTTASYPADGDDRIRDEIIRYIGGVDSQGVLWDGIGLGEDVVWTALIHAARHAPGVLDVDVLVGASPDEMSRGNVSIGIRQVAETSLDKITISRSG